jgi:hypothetical protein
MTNQAMIIMEMTLPITNQLLRKVNQHRKRGSIPINFLPQNVEVFIMKKSASTLNFN